MKTLNDVADFFETHNWGKGSWYKSASDAYCVTGAMAAIAGADWKNYDFKKLNSEQYKKLYDELVHKVKVPLPQWNDNVVKSKEELIEILRS
jgi:hypothetical protein